MVDGSATSKQKRRVERMTLGLDDEQASRRRDWLMRIALSASAGRRAGSSGPVRSRGPAVGGSGGQSRQET